MMAETHQAISTVSCHQDKTSSCHLHGRNSSSSNHHYHQHHDPKARHVNSNMAPRPSSSAWAPSSNKSSIMTPRHHQVISSKAPPSSSSKDQVIIKYIDWTMGSTIKCNGSKPSPRTTSSTIIIKASISIIWAPPHHQGPHRTISAHHVYKHQSSCIVLWPLQGSPSSELYMTVVGIKDNHQYGVGINDNL